MQLAGCAEARNSPPRKGATEPMLADAMIDNDQELHWETVDGKPVVKDGPWRSHDLPPGQNIDAFND